MARKLRKKQGNPSQKDCIQHQRYLEMPVNHAVFLSARTVG